MAFATQLYKGPSTTLRAAENHVALWLQVFKYILQYLRAVRDQQPFACAESLTRDQLAAIAAEAHFYGLADLYRATLERNTKAEYEYKYFSIIDNGEGNNSVTWVYSPKVQICPPPYASKEVISWQKVGESAKEMIPGTPPATDLDADPSNLLHLHTEGWEHVHSHVTPRGTGGQSRFIVVLRRRL